VATLSTNLSPHLYPHVTDEDSCLSTCWDVRDCKENVRVLRSCQRHPEDLLERNNHVRMLPLRTAEIQTWGVLKAVDSQRVAKVYVVVDHAARTEACASLLSQAEQW
jgi:hypothetical protein